MVPRRPPRPLVAGLPRRVEGARPPAAGRGKHRDPAGLTLARLTGGDADPSAGAPGVALANDPHTVGAAPAGLVWSAMCCTV